MHLHEFLEYCLPPTLPPARVPSLIEDDGSTVETMLDTVPEWERFSAADVTTRRGLAAAAAERQNRERMWFERLAPDVVALQEIDVAIGPQARTASAGVATQSAARQAPPGPLSSTRMAVRPRTSIAGCPLR